MRPAAALLACLALSAPVAAEHADGFAEPWRWVTFDEDSGLPSAGVLAVVETPSRTPWVATTEGVAWYDGHAWIPVLASEPAQRRRIDRIHPWGRDGVAGVSAGDVVLVGPREQQRIDDLVPGIPLSAWEAIEIDDGLLVLAGERGIRPDRLIRAHPGTGDRATIETGGPVRPFQLLDAGDGSVVVAAIDGVHRRGSGAWERLLPENSNRYAVISALAVGDETLVSLEAPVDMRGLWSLAPGREPQRVGEGATALCRSPGGGVLAALVSGTVRERLGTDWRDVESRADLFRGVSALALREGGDLWVGTDRGLHLHRRSTRLWESWRLPGSDLRNHVAAILPRADGSTWLATDGGVVVRRADGSVETVDSLGGEALRQVTALGEDSRGRAWIGSGASWGGAWRHDGTWTRIGEAEGFPAQRVHAIRRLADGRTFFLCIPAGPWSMEATHPAVFLLRDDDTFEPWGKEHGIEAARAYDVALAADGTLWFATGTGLVRLRDGVARVFTRSDGLPFGRAFCVAVGPDGRAWAGAQENGLAVVGPGDQVSLVGFRDGLVDDEVWGMTFDHEGRLWATTRRGLSVVAPEGIECFRSESGLGVTWTWPCVESSGRLLVGTLGGGVGILDLAALAGEPSRVRMQAPVVERNAALVRWSALAAWGDPPPRRVETRLRLDDGAWSAWSQQRELMLRNLSPGEHAVRVEARAHLGSSRGSSAESTFRVPQPAWRRSAYLATATAVLVALLSVVIAWLVRTRRERLLLLASERRYRELVETASEVVFALDASGTIAWTNPAGAELLGMQPCEMVGHDALEWVAPESRQAASDAMARVLRTGSVVTFESAAVAKDGSRRLVEVALGPGTRGGWQGIGRDITDRRLRDEEKQRAERLESLGLLAGGVAHDFNNVLAGVVGHVGLALLEVPEDSPARPRLEQVERAAMRCADLARQMLDYAGRGRFSVGSLDVAAVAREAVALSETWLPRHATVLLECAPDLPRIEGDASQLQRVIDNLVRNAAEAVPTGDAVIRVSVRHAPDGAAGVRGSWAGVPPPGPVVLLIVADEGEGMTDETRSRAFDPFYSTRKEGRGLGLAATLGIVRAHGGAIAVDSAPGRGATFTAALPVAP